MRFNIENYIENHPDFLTSLNPLKIDEDDPELIKELKSCSHRVGVGPMAGIAGLFSEKIGRFLLDEFNNRSVIVENGGDVFLAVEKDCISGIYAGEKSPLSGKIGIKIKAEKTPLGICTSAGTVGPSLSLGNADAVVVIAKSTVIADTTATALANKIVKADNISNVINKAKKIKDIDGVIIIKDEKIGIYGDIEIVKINL